MNDPPHPLRLSIREFANREDCELLDIVVLDAKTAKRTTASFTVQFRSIRRAPSVRKLVAKWYSDDTGSAAAETVRRLCEQLYEHKCEVLRIPHCVHYDSHYRVLFQQFAQGDACGDLFWTAHCLEAIYNSGRALAELHSLPVNGDMSKSLSDHVAEMIRPHDVPFDAMFPEYSDLLRFWLDELLRQSERQSQFMVPSPLHRDYQLRQLFFDRPHVEVIDWDDFAIGDPAFDVGYMVTYLKTHFPTAMAKKVISEFRRGYSHNGHASVFDRIEIFEAFNLIRRSARRMRLRDRNWRDQIHQMMAMLRAMR